MRKEMKSLTAAVRRLESLVAPASSSEITGRNEAA
jgi:hypothetical protein